MNTVWDDHHTVRVRSSHLSFCSVIGTFSKVNVGGQLLPAMTYMLLNSQTIQTAK